MSVPNAHVPKATRAVLCRSEMLACVGKAVLFSSFFVIIVLEPRLVSDSGWLDGWMDWSVGWMLISHSAVCIN